MKQFTITKKEGLPGSMFLIEGELSAESLTAQRKNALEKFQAMFAIDGFRKGHVPEKILVERVGELGVTEEEGSLALEKAYASIIEEAGIVAIGQPKVSITKIAPGQPMGFKIETAVAPEVSLPDYKKLAKEVVSVEGEMAKVEDKEVEDALKDIRQSIAHQKFHKTHGDTEHHNHDIKEEDLPEVNDEFVKGLGNFENVEDFKTRLKANLLNEKQVKGREKKRIAIMDAIIGETKVDVPELLVESELLKMIGQFKDSISQMGLTYEEYLKKINKTEQDIENEWKNEAKKRATIQLILNKIAATENIKADEAEVKHQTEELAQYYKEADPLRLHIYVETMMTNEKVWKFLEEQK
jgi:FKBP-type peptidyl-prolyl cis-trans isomerase (trigger factor)